MLVQIYTRRKHVPDHTYHRALAGRHDPYAMQIMSNRDMSALRGMRYKPSAGI